MKITEFGTVTVKPDGKVYIEGFAADFSAAPPVRVWRMNDCDWIAARTRTEAINCYLQFSGASREDVLADDPQPLSEADMAKLTFVTEDEEPDVTAIAGRPVYKRHAFAVQLQQLIDSGCEFPCFFASTEF